MSSHTTVAWTDATWNPVTGCTEVSPGCDHCYARTFAERFRGVAGHPYTQGFDLTLWPRRLTLPLKWCTPRRIFVNSMSDLFHTDVPTDFILAVFETMAQASWHTFQVLTKHPAWLPGCSTSLAARGRGTSGVASRSKQRCTWDEFPRSGVPPGPTRRRQDDDPHPRPL